MPSSRTQPSTFLPNLPQWLDRVAWPYEPRWLELRDGGHLHFVREGQGPQLVCVHGTPTWSFEWRHVIRALAATHQVLAVDHLGFGLSERPSDANYAPAAHAARFAEMMSELCPREPVSLVVHDFGGPIALDWALEHPERLSHLVVVNTWMWPFDDDPLMRRRAALVQGALGRWLYRRLNASLRLVMPSAYADKRLLTPAVHAQYLAVFPDADSRERVLFALARSLLGASDFYASLWARRERLSRVPMTLLWGMQDSAFQPALLERWQQTFPHANVVRCEQAGHWPHEEAPLAFVDALATALRPAAATTLAAPRRRAGSQDVALADLP